MIYTGSLHKATASAYGSGNSSYGAETRAILDALCELESLPHSIVSLYTDCQCFLVEARCWKYWDTQIEANIAKAICRLTKGGKKYLYTTPNHTTTSPPTAQ